MGTALTGSSVASTYDALLKITDNGPVGGTAKVVTDGLGNDSCFKLGTTSAEFTGALGIDAGTVSAPGLYLEGETGTGLYRIGANNHGYAVSGSKVLDIASTGLGVTGTLSASAATDTIVGLETGAGDGRGVVAAAASANGNAGLTWRTNSVNRWTMDTVGTSDSESIRLRKLGTGATTVLTVSSTGLSVTGILGASGIITSTQANGLIQLGGGTTSFPAIRNNGSDEMGIVLADQSAYTAVRATAFNVSSDARLKENIRDLTDSGRYIDSLRPRIFDWKAGGKDVFGFIAQEANEVFPQAVTIGDEWGMDAGKFMPLAIAELKSLRARLAAAGIA